jgi:hypothetical protein
VAGGVRPRGQKPQVALYTALIREPSRALPVVLEGTPAAGPHAPRPLWPGGDEAGRRQAAGPPVRARGPQCAPGHLVIFAAGGLESLEWVPHLGSSYVTRSPAGVAFHEPYGSCGLAQLWRQGRVPPKLRVIPGECWVVGCGLMIICPYPFCSANWKSCSVPVQVAFEAARCVAQCVDVR